MKIIVITGPDNDLLYKFQSKNYEDLGLLDFPENETHPSKHFKNVQKWLKNSNTFGWTETCIITHSEHVINGLRIYSMTNEVDIRIFFIEEDKTTEITIDKKGELSEWPVGFCDQAEQDYLEILKLRK